MNGNPKEASMARPPFAPPGERVYAIGDIHGSLLQLETLVRRIEEDIAQHPGIKGRLVFLGDYIDRGPFSKGVIEFVLHGLPASLNAFFLRGNHEDMILRFLKGDMPAGEGWLQYGGIATLLSYGIAPPATVTPETMAELQKNMQACIPPEHLKFFADAKLYLILGDYCFVHAGIKPSVAMSDQSQDDFLWIRKEFLVSQADHGKMIIHGHNISLEPDIRSNRIGIDTGAYATGRLTCLVLQDDKQHMIHT
jgi:serine/threonine protein phosphatase 1